MTLPDKRCTDISTDTFNIRAAAKPATFSTMTLESLTQRVDSITDPPKRTDTLRLLLPYVRPNTVTID